MTSRSVLKFIVHRETIVLKARLSTAKTSHLQREKCFPNSKSYPLIRTKDWGAKEEFYYKLQSRKATGYVTQGEDKSSFGAGQRSLE